MRYCPVTPPAGHGNVTVCPASSSVVTWPHLRALSSCGVFSCWSRGAMSLTPTATPVKRSAVSIYHRLWICHGQKFDIEYIMRAITRRLVSIIELSKQTLYLVRMDDIFEYLGECVLSTRTILYRRYLAKNMFTWLIRLRVGYLYIKCTDLWNICVYLPMHKNGLHTSTSNPLKYLVLLCCICGIKFSLMYFRNEV